MSRKNEEPQESSVSLRVPDFVGEDGVVYSDIEITVESEGDVRDVLNLTKTLERGANDGRGNVPSSVLSGRPDRG
jgi:hypothetical protein